MAVTLINTFIVPEDQEAEFLKNWRETTQVFSHTPGFIETHYLSTNKGVTTPGSPNFLGVRKNRDKKYTEG